MKAFPLSLFVFSFLSSSLMASNGTLLIGSSATSRAMGGVGIATFTGSEAALKNPAMLMANSGDQFDVSSTAIFESATSSATILGSSNSEDYGEDVPFSPSLGYLHNINKEMVFAVHSAAVGGGAVAVDYGSNSHAVFVKFAAEQAFVDTAFAFAYKKSSLSLGASLIVNYSTFETSVNGGTNSYDPSTSLGFQLGTAYKHGAYTYGLTYKSERSVHNKFISGPTSGDYYKEIPAELGMGLQYKVDALTLSFDMKDIFWSKSGTVNGAGTADEGYASDRFRDQIVFALGSSYRYSKALIYRVGFNYGENPITDRGLSLGAANKIHALSEKHLTAGLSYNISKLISLDSAITYSPKNSESVSSGTAIAPVAISDVTYVKQQRSFTLGATIKF